MTTSPGSFPPRSAVTPAELRKRAHARLQDRIDPARNRHKPLSLVRQDAKRVLEQLLDADAPTLGRSERDRLVEDVIAEAPGLGPLEELFRDEAVKEILILAENKVIALKGEVWLPTSARFRDAEQVRSVLARFADTGEPLVTLTAVGGFDVRLANGFRVIGIAPPEVMEQAPTVLLVRGAVPVSGGSGVVQLGAGSATVATPGPRSSGPLSGSTDINPRATPAVGSGVVPLTAAPPAASLSGRMPAPSDPFAKARQRVTERIIAKFAAAGAFDLSVIPTSELRKIVLAHVAEFNVEGKFGWDDAYQDRLALQILAGMNR